MFSAIRSRMVAEARVTAFWTASSMLSVELPTISMIL
jgi:hypothetical protein